MDTSWLTILLILLLVLACPVGMWLMMRGDKKHSHNAGVMENRPDRDDRRP